MSGPEASRCGLFDDSEGPSLVVMNVTWFCLMALRGAPGSSFYSLFSCCPKHSVSRLVAYDKPLSASSSSSGFSSLWLKPDEYRCMWAVSQQTKAEDTSKWQQPSKASSRVLRAGAPLCLGLGLGLGSGERTGLHVAARSPKNRSRRGAVL